MLDYGLRELMTQIVLLAKRSGSNDYGEGSYESAIPYKCRISGKHTLVRNDKGQEEVARFVLWLATPSGATPEYRLTMLDGSNPLILSVETFRDEFGNAIEKIYLR